MNISYSTGVFPTRFKFNNSHYSPTQTNTWHCSRFQFPFMYSAGAFIHSHYKWIQESNQWCLCHLRHALPVELELVSILSMSSEFLIPAKNIDKKLFNFLHSFHRATCRIKPFWLQKRTFHLDYHALLSRSPMTGKKFKINCHESAWPVCPLALPSSTHHVLSTLSAFWINGTALYCFESYLTGISVKVSWRGGMSISDMTTRLNTGVT